MYKRQGLRTKSDAGAVNILLGFTYDNKPFTVKDLGAVSYTHLDVYKRQGKDQSFYGDDDCRDATFRAGSL